MPQEQTHPAAPRADVDMPTACRVSGKVMWVSLLVLLLFMPSHPGVLRLFGQGPIRYWKEAVFVIACAACCVCLAKRPGRLRQVRVAVGLGAVYVLLVLLRAALGYRQGQDRWLLLAGTVNAVFFVPGFLMAVSLLRRPAQIRRAMTVILCVATLAGAMSVADWRWGLSERLGDPGEAGRQIIAYDQAAARSQLTFESPMVLAMFIGMGLLVGTWISADSSRPAGIRLLAAACSAVCLAGMFLTFSRGPLVSCLVGAMVIWAFAYDGLNLRSLKENGGTLLVVLLVVLYGGVLTVWLMPAGYREYLGSVFNWLDDQHNVTRLRRMRHGWDMFTERPAFGHGMGTAQQRFFRYRTEQLGADPFYRNPESMFLLLAVEGGLLLTVAYVMVFAAMFYWTVQLARPPTPPEIRRIAVLLVGIQTALLLESVIMPMLDTRTFKLGFWVMFGAVAWLRFSAGAVPDRPVLSTDEHKTARL